MATRGARRSPTADELRTWRDFIEVSHKVRFVIESRLQTQSDLSSGDYAVMLALFEAEDQRLRPSAIASQIDWDRTRLSHHLARMEKRGLVDRQPCATDSRGIEVVLTEKGRSSFRRASAPHMHAIQDLFVDALSADQQRSLDAATRALSEHLARLSATDRD
jgi:DNA-binding MarR family transcriptional regulator